MLPGLVISVLALVIAFRNVPIQDLFKALARANYWLVALGFMTSLVWLAVRGFFWRTLLQGKAPYKMVFLTLSEGYLLNNVLPFRLGEIGRAMLLSQKSSLKFWQVIPTIVIERALDVAFAAGLLLITLPFVVSVSWAKTAAILSGGLVLAGLVFLYILARGRETAIRLFEKAAARLPILDRLAGNALPSFLNGISVLTDLRLFVTAILWEALDWGIAVFQYYFLVRAFFPEAQILWGAFALAIAALGVAVPSSPGAVGVLELALTFAIGLFSKNASAALAFALVAHLSNYIINGIIGSYALSQEGETLTGLYHSARNLLARQKTESEIIQPPS